MAGRPLRRRLRPARLAALLALCAIATGCYGRPPHAAQPGPSGAMISTIRIKATSLPLDGDNPSKTKIGQLTYLAGYELTANDRRFGGLSGLVITPDGSRLTAISDRGYWVSMMLKYSGDKLTGIGAAKLGVLGSNSTYPLTKKEADSESIALDKDGSYLVGFEEVHRIWRYPPEAGLPGPEAMSGKPVNVPMPALLQRARDNQSLEDLTVLPDGRILAALESPIPGEKYNHAWLVDRNGHASDLYYIEHDKYRPTDLTVLPDGNVMVVERYFEPIFDVRARFRIIKLSDIKPGAHLQGKLIGQLKAPLTVDNMEGLASRKAPDGSTLIYVVSDDNYSALQRTLLLEFRLDQ